MRTAREVLLSRHEKAKPALDEISNEVVAAMRAPGEGRPATTRGLRTLAEWLWPSPVAWGAVAAVWVIIVGLNIAARPDNGKASPKLVAQSPQRIKELREQKRLFVELVTVPAADAEPARLPRPQSRREDGMIPV